MGLVFCIKQSYLDIPIAVLIFLGFLAWVEKDRYILRNILLMGLGFLLVNIPVFLYFQVNGALRDYVINAFLFNRYYSYQTISGRINSLLEMIKFVSSHPFFFFVASLWLGVLILLSIKRRQTYTKGLTIDLLRVECAKLDWRHPGPETLLFLGLIDFPIFFLTISLSGKLWTHYYVPLFPAIILLLAGSLATLYRSTEIQSKQVMLNSLLVAALVTGSFPPLYQVATNFNHARG